MFREGIVLNVNSQHVIYRPTPLFVMRVLVNQGTCGLDEARLAEPAAFSELVDGFNVKAGAIGGMAKQPNGGRSGNQP